MGTYESFYGYKDKAHINIFDMKRLVGPIHTEIYAFASHDGNVDLYVKAALTRPMFTYTH